MPNLNPHDLAQKTLESSQQYGGTYAVLHHQDDQNGNTLSFAVGSTEPQTAQNLERNHALLEQAIARSENGKEPFMHPADIIEIQRAELESLRAIALAAWNVAVRSVEAHQVSVVPPCLLQDLKDALTQSSAFFTPPPNPQPTLPCAYSDDLHQWEKPYSLEAALEVAEAEGLEVIFQSVPCFPVASSFLPQIMDLLSDEAHELYFDQTEGWPNTTDRQRSNLQKAVGNTVDIWVKLNHLEPTFCIFEDMVEIPLEQARKMLEEAKAVLEG